MTDLSDERALVDLVAGHQRRYGRLDVLVSAAGQAMGGIPVEVMPTSLVDRQFEVNLRAPLLLSREAIPMLRAAGAEPFRRMGIADQDMIQPGDLLAVLRLLSTLCPGCAIPEVQFDSPAATKLIEATARGRGFAADPAV